jgi:hypothetical protein
VPVHIEYRVDKGSTPGNGPPTSSPFCPVAVQPSLRARADGAGRLTLLRPRQHEDYKDPTETDALRGRAVVLTSCNNRPQEWRLRRYSMATGAFIFSNEAQDETRLHHPMSAIFFATRGTAT